MRETFMLWIMEKGGRLGEEGEGSGARRIRAWKT